MKSSFSYVHAVSYTIFIKNIGQRFGVVTKMAENLNVHIGISPILIKRINV